MADGPPKKTGRPRLGTGSAGDREASLQSPITFGPGQKDRLKALGINLATSRNRLVARAAREFIANHSRKRTAPRSTIPKDGAPAQWIPEAGQVDKLGQLATTWGMTRVDALRIAVEDLLESEGFPYVAAPAAEPATTEES